MNQRVVVTGMGAVSPLGVGVPTLWEGLLAGRSGISAITAFDTSAYEVHRGGVIPDFDGARGLDPASADDIGQAARLAIAATREALADSGLAGHYAPEDVGVCLGTTNAEIQAIEAMTSAGHDAGAGPDVAAPTVRRQCPASHIPGQVAAEFGFGGPNSLVPTACAAGNYAIGHGYDMIRQGRARAMVVGGVDPYSQVAFTGFHKLACMASDVPRPFAADRPGMMVGEGAGVLVLETLESAQKRGAPIYAEVLGYGLSCDAHHMTAPHPEGRGAVDAMTRALQASGLAPETVGYVSAHGTGTATNDRIETQAIKQVFGEATRVPVSSIKSMLGHTMGAASALEAIACVLAIRDGMVPPTANLNAPDPECDLDCVPNTAREARVDVALSNAYAFGGNNAALLVGRVKETV